MKKSILLILLIASSLAACKKDKESSATDLLTRAPWIVSLEEYDDHGTWKEWQHHDYLYRDLLFTFNKSGTCRVESTSAGQANYSKYSKWAFADGGNTIWIYDFNIDWKILSLTKERLQVQHRDIAPGEPVERATFVHP